MNASPLNNGKLKCLAKVILFYVLFIVLLAGFSFFKSLFTEKYERLAFGILGTAAGLLIILIFLKAEKKLSGMPVFFSAQHAAKIPGRSRSRYPHNGNGNPAGGVFFRS